MIWPKTEASVNKVEAGPNGQAKAVTHPIGADELANSVGPDQTAPLGAV